MLAKRKCLYVLNVYDLYDYVVCRCTFDFFKQLDISRAHDVLYQIGESDNKNIFNSNMFIFSFIF